MAPGAPVFQVRTSTGSYFKLLNPFVSCSKTSLMDPRFAPAWVAFGHTFALEGEHDHAVTAYSTCARMFTGYVSC
jgi:hypothetical protein